MTEGLTRTCHCGHKTAVATLVGRHCLLCRCSEHSLAELGIEPACGPRCTDPSHEKDPVPVSVERKKKRGRQPDVATHSVKYWDRV